MTSLFAVLCHSTAQAEKRCASAHSEGRGLTASSLTLQDWLSTAAQEKLAVFRKAFLNRYSPQEIFTVAISEDAAPLVAAIQSAAPESVMNLPLRAPRHEALRNTYQNQERNLVEFIRSQMPSIRTLAGRRLLLLSVGQSAAEIEALRQAFASVYRSVGWKMEIEVLSPEISALEPDRSQALLPNTPLMRAIAATHASETREWTAFDPSQYRYADQEIRRTRNNNYDRLREAARQTLWREQFAR